MNRSQYPYEPVPPAAEHPAGPGVLERVAVALVALCVAAGVLAGLVAMFGCAGTQQRVPLSGEHQRIVDLTAATWRELGMPWTQACTRAFARLQIDHRVDRCYSPAHGCLAFEDGRSVLHVETGASASLVVHELVHLAHQCALIERGGDPGHASGAWRTPGVDPRVDARPEAAVVRRVMGLPEPEATP